MPLADRIGLWEIASRRLRWGYRIHDVGWNHSQRHLLGIRVLWQGVLVRPGCHVYACIVALRLSAHVRIELQPASGVSSVRAEI